MTLLKPYALGADGQVIPGRLMRLALGSAFRPAAAGVSAISGILYGPANTMGEGSLLSSVLLRINPFTAVIQGTQQGTQGQYVVPNDAAVDLAVLGQHASQYRRLMAVVRVADSQIAGVASTALTDNSFLELLDGGLSALNPPPLPALPDNALAIGEVLVPPVGQAVTWTPYNPRTTTRGGILPVIDDASVIPGHAGAAGAHLGAYRDHPIYGLQRWDGAVWGPLASPPRVAVTFSNSPTVVQFPAGELVRVWKDGPDTVRLQGMAQVAGGWSTTAFAAFTIPIGYRPALDIVRSAAISQTATSVQLARVNLVSATGVVNITGQAAFAGSGFLVFDLSWRTTNAY